VTRAAFALLLALAACKSEPTKTTSPSASASASAAPPASAAPSASAANSRYVGTYEAKRAELFVPDAGEYEGFKFRGDADAGALGPGTLSFSVDPATGVVSGELEGPLGPGTIAGVAHDGSLSFHLTPRGGEDAMAFRGTATGTLDGGAATGRIQASSWRANVLREADFTATKK